MQCSKHDELIDYLKKKNLTDEKYKKLTEIFYCIFLMRGIYIPVPTHKYAHDAVLRKSIPFACPSRSMGRADTKGAIMNIMKKIELENMRMDLPKFRSGDTIKVHLRIVEGEKERIQMFQGNVIRIKRGTTDATFTVRKVSNGIGVERIFPTHSPFIERIEVISLGRVRRSRLYYLRELKGKAARIKPRNRY